MIENPPQFTTSDCGELISPENSSPFPSDSFESSDDGTVPERSNTGSEPSALPRIWNPSPAFLQRSPYLINWFDYDDEIDDPAVDLALAPVLTPQSESSHFYRVRAISLE